jgi:hypothetical protein
MATKTTAGPLAFGVSAEDEGLSTSTRQERAR